MLQQGVNILTQLHTIWTIAPLHVFLWERTGIHMYVGVQFMSYEAAIEMYSICKIRAETRRVLEVAINRTLEAVVDSTAHRC